MNSASIDVKCRLSKVVVTIRTPSLSGYMPTSHQSPLPPRWEGIGSGYAAAVPFCDRQLKTNKQNSSSGRNLNQ